MAITLLIKKMEGKNGEQELTKEGRKDEGEEKNERKKSIPLSFQYAL